MQKRVFLIHGWDGKPTGNWFPYLSLELKANGFEVNAPQMPNAAHPKVSEWISFLKEYVGKPDKDTYFVGHSLGCIAIARYLETLSPKSSYSPLVKGVPDRGRDVNTPPPTQSRSAPIVRGDIPSFPSSHKATKGHSKKGGIKIGGCVFVAGFSGRINVPEIAEFYSLPFDPEQAKAHSDNFVMIFSDNDSYVPMEKSLEMAKQLGAKTILERGKGHFQTNEGVITLPSALSALLRMSA